MKVSVGDKDFVVVEGASLLIWMSPKGTFLRFPWVSKFTDVSEPSTFTDIQTIGPFAFWKHTHSFTVTEGGTVIDDFVEYAIPGWFLGDKMIGTLVARQLEETFRYRRTLLAEHHW
jgi:ligand-binding SRPBCC domain-containing protein